MAISAVGEGCYKQMETLLPDIVNTVLPFLTDPHPRVRYAACNAVGQLSSDFAPGFQKKFHARVSFLVREYHKNVNWLLNRLKCYGHKICRGTLFSMRDDLFTCQGCH